MKGLFFLLIFTFSLHQHAWSLQRIESFASFAPRFKVPRGSRVAIVGAGLSGLHLTRWLKENGYRVTTFEKNSASKAWSKHHGKVLTLDLGHQSVVEMGPIQVGPTHDFTHNYQQELNIKSFEPHDSYVVRPGPKYGTHQILEPHEAYFPKGEQLAILQETLRFEKIFRDFYRQYPTVEDVPNDSEFAADLASFMKRHDLPHFHEQMKIYSSAYGFGKTSEIKTFKALHMMPASALLFWLYWNLNPKMLSGGFGGLADALITRYKLHENIKYNQHIKAIHRSSLGVIVEHFNGDTENFDTVIFACPIDKIMYAIDATDEEKALYENLHYSPYATFASQMVNSKRGGCIFQHNLDHNCHVQMASDNSPTDRYVIFYVPLHSSAKASQLGSLMQALPNAEQLQITLKEDLSALGFEIQEIAAYKIWHQYNPHFQKPSFYKLGKSMQGKNNTYYASTMLGTIDYANEAFRQAHRLLQENFEGDFPEPNHSLWNRMQWHFRAENLYGEERLNY